MCWAAGGMVFCAEFAGTGLLLQFPSDLARILPDSSVGSPPRKGDGRCGQDTGLVQPGGLALFMYVIRVLVIIIPQKRIGIDVIRFVL